MKGVDYYKAVNISVTAPVTHGGNARFEHFSGLNQNIGIINTLTIVILLNKLKLILFFL